MTTKRVSYPVELKALGGTNGDAGRVEALVSIFNNVDLMGDRVVPGAFAKNIKEWKASGDPIPVVFSHEWGDLWSHIGQVDSLEETPKGLRAVYTLDIADNPAAAQTFKLLKRRTLKEHSFAYDVVTERRAKDGANELTELKIIELGPTLKGANPDTELIAVKAALEAEADSKIDKSTQRASVSGRKVYLDADLPGTFEETRDAICEAARALLNPSSDENTYVYVEATYPDSALVEVHRSGAEDEHYEVSWSRADDDSIALGEPIAVDVNVTVTPKSATKAGRRLSEATQKELSSIRDDATSLVTRIDSLLGTAEDMPKSADVLEREAAQIEAPTKNADDQEPLARSDAETLQLRSLIAEMSATEKESNGSNSS